MVLSSVPGAREAQQAGCTRGPTAQLSRGQELAVCLWAGKKGACKKGGPEVRIFEGAHQIGLKRKPLHSQLCSGVLGVSVDSSTSSSGWEYWGGVTSRCWENSPCRLGR
jgi:hypothetical protein